MDKIPEKSKYAITHIVFNDSLSLVKSNIFELEKLMLKMSKPNSSSCSYVIEKTKSRYNIFTFDTTDYGNIKILDTVKQFRNLTENETALFFTLVNFFDRNELNGMTISDGSILFNYCDFITVPNNWTERTLILKRNNSSTNSWIDMSDKVDETKDFVLVEEP